MAIKQTNISIISRRGEGSEWIRVEERQIGCNT